MRGGLARECEDKKHRRIPHVFWKSIFYGSGMKILMCNIFVLKIL